MIEEIEKEMLENSEEIYADTYITESGMEEESSDNFVRLSKINSILKKYDNQHDYKKMWEELKERMNDDRFCPCFMDMQELEQKYNIGDKNE